MENVARKMKPLIGLGPIPDRTISHFENSATDSNEALVLAAKEYLQYYLDYNPQELKNLKIKEVKRAAKDSVVYIAVENESDIREIHYRKTQARNNDLIIRDYIPPSFHSRFKAITAKATQRRAADKDLKTQVRWGDRDLEIFTKKKGSPDPYIRVNLRDFMGESDLPDFDVRIQWKTRPGIQRRNLTFDQYKLGLPSLGNSLQTLIRQHSLTSESDRNKRIRRGSSNTSDAQMSDSEETLVDPLCQVEV